MILINGWWFDFENMMAHRDIKHQGFRNVIDFRINEGQIYYKNSNGDCDFLGFFVEPEDHYNEKIIKAYADWAFEKEVL